MKKTYKQFVFALSIIFCWVLMACPGETSEASSDESTPEETTAVKMAQDSSATEADSTMTTTDSVQAMDSETKEESEASDDSGDKGNGAH